jgi:hypothetical protein
MVPEEQQASPDVGDERSGHTAAEHGLAGHTDGVDLRGSSVATNTDDISMDLPSTPPVDDDGFETNTSGRV